MTRSYRKRPLEFLLSEDNLYSRKEPVKKKSNLTLLNESSSNSNTSVVPDFNPHFNKIRKITAYSTRFKSEARIISAAGEPNNYTTNTFPLAKSSTKPRKIKTTTSEMDFTPIITSYPNEANKFPNELEKSIDSTIINPVNSADNPILISSSPLSPVFINNFTSSTTTHNGSLLSLSPKSISPGPRTLSNSSVDCQFKSAPTSSTVGIFSAGKHQRKSIPMVSNQSSIKKQTNSIYNANNSYSNQKNAYPQISNQYDIWSSPCRSPQPQKPNYYTVPLIPLIPVPMPNTAYYSPNIPQPKVIYIKPKVPPARPIRLYCMEPKIDVNGAMLDPHKVFSHPFDFLRF